MKKQIDKKQDIFLSKEQKRMKNIISADQYNIELDKWEKIKIILDEIYKKIPPFGEVKKISKKSANIFTVKEQVKLFEKNIGIKISLNPNEFSSETQLFFKPALKFLLNMGVIAYTNYEYGGIVTSQPYRKFLEGNILIRNKENFVNFYEKFIQFYDIMEKYKKTKDMSSNTLSQDLIYINVIDKLINTGLDINKEMNECSILKWKDNKPFFISYNKYLNWKNDVENQLDKMKIYKLANIGFLYQNDNDLPSQNEALNIAYSEQIPILLVQNIVKKMNSKIAKIINFLRETKSNIYSTLRIEKEKIIDAPGKTSNLQNNRHPKTKRKKKTNPLFFDEEKSLLIVKGKRIKIKRFSYQYHLLKIIFENKTELNREWFFSEVAEKYDLTTSPKSEDDKKFYNAIAQIKIKIATETKIKDFFRTTSQSFQINKNYLEAS